jgi:thioesterase domain-containing protein/acyl carrier protein
VLVRLERLPLTLNGKVDRQALPAPEPAEAREGHVPPRTPLERTLARIWSEVLRVPQVGVDERFFDLGGDSLLAVRLMAQVKKQVGRDLPISALLDEGTVERMAAALSQEESVLGSPLISIRAEGPRPPLVLVHPGSGDVLCYHDLARHLSPHRSVYALQDPGLQGRWDFSIPLPEMAKHYVEALRELYPDGPYLRGGWSFGGLVAFEMAGQIAAAGAEVPLLALLDAGAPSMIEKLAEVNDDAVLLGVIAREWGLDLSSDELRALLPAEQVALVFERLKGAGAAFPDMDAAWLQRKLDLFKARIQVARSYRPPVYPGRITLFRSGQVDPEDLKDLPGLYAELASDATMGWSDLSRQPVEIHTVSGHHANLASEPHVGVLARQLRDCLERALAPTGRVQP